MEIDPGELAVREVTRALRAIEEGHPRAAEDLLPLVYEELRRVARGKVARLPPGATVQATDLVHEAWLRLTEGTDPGWGGRAHFFAAAANAMRNILVEQARARASLKRGGGSLQSLQEDEPGIISAVPGEKVLALHEALERFERDYPRAARIVSLRFFGGLVTAEVAELLELSITTVEREWRFARAWLQREIGLASE
ncbi:MAG: RNA polymerase sigma factor (TIGR02999 family) [Chlamydiales bacterium]|jgi:RNA polymerase sigma factor (TIGR02999 family)